MRKGARFLGLVVIVLAQLVPSLANAQPCDLPNLSCSPGASTGVSMAVAGGNVYVLWQDDTPGKSDVFLRRSTDGGQSFVASVNLSDSTGDSRLSSREIGASSPMAVSGSNVYVVWDDDTDPPGLPKVLYRRSSDGGATFGAAVDLSQGSVFAAAPQVFADGSVVHVLWIDLDFSPSRCAPTSVCSRNVFYRRSTDGGFTFEAARNLSASTTNFAGFPWVAVNGTHVHVVWSTNVTTLGQEVVYRRSADAGASFEAPLGLSGQVVTTGGDGGVQVVAAAANVYVLWREVDQQNQGVLRVRASQDLGATFGSTLTVSDGTRNASNPRLAGSDSRAYVIWGDAPPDNSSSRILFARSTDAGLTIGAPAELSPSRRVPDIAAIGNAVHVIWGGPPAGPSYDLFHQLSTDGGQTFTQAVNVSNTGSGGGGAPNQRVLAGGTTAYIVWGDRSPGNEDIFFGRRPAPAALLGVRVDDLRQFVWSTSFEGAGRATPPIHEGASTPFGRIKIDALVTATDGGDVCLEVEVRRVEEVFVGAGGSDVGACGTSGTRIELVTAQLPSGAYKWRARARNGNATGPWLEFGVSGNSDFVIRPPVALIHGYCGSATVATWGAMEELLRSSLFTGPAATVTLDESGRVITGVHMMDYGNNREGGLAWLAGLVAARVRTILRAFDAKQIDVVAHSMGGLVTRAWIAGMAVDDGDGAVSYGNEVRRIIMAGTPNYGAPLGVFARLQRTCDTPREPRANQGREMQFGSHFVWVLHHEWQDSDFARQKSGDILTIAGLGDDVVPIPSATLTGEAVRARLVDKDHVSVNEPHTDGIVFVDETHPTFKLAKHFLLNGEDPPESECPSEVCERGLGELDGMLLFRIVDGEDESGVGLIREIVRVTVDQRVRPWFNPEASAVTIWPLTPGDHAVKVWSARLRPRYQSAEIHAEIVPGRTTVYGDLELSRTRR